MKKLLQLISLSIALCTCSIIISNAQSATITPDGVLVPKISLTYQLNSPDPIVNPAEGLLIYNIGDNQAVGFYYWNGSAWQFLGGIGSLTATGPISISSNNIQLNAGTSAGQLLTWDGYNWVNTSPKYPQEADNHQPYLALNFCIATQGIFPSRNGDSPFLAEIAMFGFGFEPRGWVYCNGQIMSIAQNTALFSLLGTSYGGNGTTTFGIPDLRGRTPVHFGTGNGLNPVVIGQMGGTQTISIDNKY